MIEQTTSDQRDEARLETSLADLRKQLEALDRIIDEQVEVLVRKRRYLVEVIWEVKDAMGVEHIDWQREHEIDERRSLEGMPPTRVEIHRQIRYASRPETP